MRPFAPASSAAAAMATASVVLSEAMPSTTGARFPTAATQVRTTAIFSSKESVCASPSEPPHTMPVQPLSIIQRQCTASAGWSTARSASRFVVMAGMTPFQFMGDGFGCWRARVSAGRGAQGRAPSKAEINYAYRFGFSMLKSTLGFRPVRSSATSRPVTGAIVSPSMAWPHAAVRLVWRLNRPM